MPHVLGRMRRGSAQTISVLAAGVTCFALAAPSAAADGVRSRQWYLDAMQAEDMWKVSRGDGLTVAVVDSGVDTSVEELRGQVLQGADMSDAQNPAGAVSDRDGHGTQMASLIAGTGAGGGVQGLAPGARILPVKVPGGLADVTDPLMANGIRYAADHGARIINISMAGPASKGHSQIEAAVSYALGKGSLVFAGSGNDGDGVNVPNYPAAAPGAVSVGAIDSTSTVTKWSNSASHVSLAAPGQEIPGRCRESAGFCATGGTSSATALASASAALIWAKHPDWTNNQVLRVMLDTAGKPTTGKIPSPYIGYGIVRPRKVILDGEGDPGPADVNPLLANAAPTPSSEPKLSAQGTPRPTAQSSSDKGDVSTLWLSIGAGAAVVVAAAVTAIVLVRRRNRTTPHWSAGSGPVG
ncbi:MULTISPECIES: S8 family serine peptidase [Streptomyces]|uniref:Type VII secretion-associated serine protease mycosin n=1 Tax=Streptomyces luteosporeus TaxID=173856 RepID=A0ABP6GL26_9ACTN